MKKFYPAVLLTLFAFSSKAQQFTNFHNATYALAATNPPSSGTAVANASCFVTAAQVCFAVDPKHSCLYVADYYGHRVLRYTYPITSNNPAANLVFGQAAFTTSVSGVASTSLSGPQGLAVDSI